MFKKITTGILVLSSVGITLFGVLLFLIIGISKKSQPAPNIMGTWRVIAYVDDETVLLKEKEFMVFDSNTVTYFLDEDADAVFSNYEFVSGLMLRFPDISREYICKAVTENILFFYNETNSHMILVRQPSDNMSVDALEKSILMERWKVTYRQTDGELVEQYLEFGKDVIKDYRNGNAEPSSHSEYFWNEFGHLIAENWKKEMAFYPLSEEGVILLEVDTGLVWELEKAK